LKAAFQSQGINYEEDPLLNLTTSLRSHRAADVTIWVEMLLEGKLGPYF
jgi:hypothetical protein